jgi:hypothetical protein
MSRRRILNANEARCQSQGCAKLLTLKIVENLGGILLWRRVPTSGLDASILANFHKAAAMTPGSPPPKSHVACRCDGGHRSDTAAIKAGDNMTLCRINI